MPYPEEPLARPVCSCILIMEGTPLPLQTTQNSRRIWGSAGRRCLRSGHNRSDMGGITETPLTCE